MRTLKLALPLGIAVTGLVLCTTTATFAKKAYADKEKKSCTFCHVKAGSKDLNDAGKYYKEHDHSLVGMKEKK